MSTTDSALNQFIQQGPSADRVAFTPNPPTPAVGDAIAYFWWETDNQLLYTWDGPTTTWVLAGSGGGGGGGGSKIIGEPQPDGFNGVGHPFYVYTLMYVDRDATVTGIGMIADNNYGSAQYQPFIYANGSGPGALLADGPQITGVTAGLNEAPLTTPLVVHKGDLVWVGISLIGSDINTGLRAHSISGFLSNGGSSVPASPFPGGGSSASGYGFWMIVS